MKRFFAEEIQGLAAILSKEELHHCIHVLRAKHQEEIEIIDGQGNLWTAEVNFITKRQVDIILGEQLSKNEVNPAQCSLAVSMTKNIDRIEWLVEKATEIGLKEFYPLITHRTERNHLRLDRLEKVALSATKQSKRLWKPTIHPPTLLQDFVAHADFEQKYIAHCIDDKEKVQLPEIFKKELPSVILIGPEGDFTSDEISLALQNNYQAVSLGNSRLRVETAALVACVMMNTI